MFRGAGRASRVKSKGRGSKAAGPGAGKEMEEGVPGEKVGSRSTLGGLFDSNTIGVQEGLGETGEHRGCSSARHSVLTGVVGPRETSVDTARSVKTSQASYIVLCSPREPSRSPSIPSHSRGNGHKELVGPTEKHEGHIADPDVRDLEHTENQASLDGYDTRDDQL